MHSFTELLPKTLLISMTSRLFSFQSRLCTAEVEFFYSWNLVLSLFNALPSPSGSALSPGAKHIFFRWRPWRRASLSSRCREHSGVRAPNAQSLSAFALSLPGTAPHGWFSMMEIRTQTHCWEIWHCFLAAGLPNGLAETPWELITV